MHACTGLHELGDPAGRQLEHQPAAYEDGEYLAAAAQRAAAEAAAALRRRDVLGSHQVIDEVRVALAGRAAAGPVRNHAVTLGGAGGRPGGELCVRAGALATCRWRTGWRC